MMGIGIWELVLIAVVLAILLFPVMVVAVVVGIMISRRKGGG